jgi:hypothetical protein
MRTLLVLALISCGATPSPALDAASVDTRTTDARPDAPAPVTIVFNWVHFEGTSPCQESPACANPGCNAVSCTCRTCATPPCQPYTLVEKCCNSAAKIRPDALSTLATDYPLCDLRQTSPMTYALDCAWNDNPPQYWTSNPVDPWQVVEGAKFKYTNDAMCEWTLPYAVP